MRWFASGMILISVAFIAVPSAVSGGAAPLLLAAVLGAAWIWLVTRGHLPIGWHHASLTAIVLLNLVACATGNWLHPVISVSAGLYAWDAAVTGRDLRGFTAPQLRRFWIRYASHAAASAAIGIAAAAIAAWVNVPLPAPAVIVLSIGCAATVAVLLRQLRGNSTRRAGTQTKD